MCINMGYSGEADLWGILELPTSALANKRQFYKPLSVY